MDAFQGCYKDGTNGTRDLRFFSAVYFLLRVVVFVMYAALAFEHYQQLQYCLLFIPLSLIVFVAVVRPYKKDLYNSLDITMFVFFIIVQDHSCTAQTKATMHSMEFQVCFYIHVLLFVISICYVCWHIFLNRCISYCVRKYGAPVWAHSLIRWFSRLYLKHFTLQYAKIITFRSSTLTLWLRNVWIQSRWWLLWNYAVETCVTQFTGVYTVKTRV